VTRRQGAGRAERFGRALLGRFVPPDTTDAILGDLLEDLRESRNRVQFVKSVCSIAVRQATLHRNRIRSSERKAARMESLLLDLKFAVRSLSKRPSFPIVVLTTLALGIGAATAIFSVVDGILLRPLPYAEPNRLVFLNETDGGRRMTFAWPNYLDLRERAQSYEAIACSQGNDFSVLSDGRPRRVPGRLVCAPFFEVLGVPLQAGRTFTAADDHAGASPVAIVSDRFWKQDLAGDPSVLGRTIRTAERTFTIVGVLPPGFWFGRPGDIFAPVGLIITRESGNLDRGNHGGLNAVARLKPGVTVARANDEISRIYEDLKRAYPNTNARSGGQVMPLADRFVDEIHGTLIALMGAVGFLLLLACVNVANLLVARSAAREHELAIRAALGGSRWRLVRQLLAESMLLSLGGGLLGIALGAWLLRGLIALAPEGIPRIEQVGLNQSSLLFGIAASVVCGLLFGAFPALQASGARGRHLLARASRTSAAVSPHRTRRLLMALETALALILLVGCGLMARTMLHLNAVDTGFRPDHLLTARIVLSGEAWNSGDRRIAFQDTLLDKLMQVPGVTRAGLTLSLPIEGSNWGSIFTVRDKPVPPRPELPTAAWVPISAGYFETMGIMLRAGRQFDARDNAKAGRVVIINTTFANRFWPGENAVGKFVKQGWPETPESDAPWREVVGVVNDVKLNGVDQDTPMQAFLPYPQEPARSMAIVLRTSTDPEHVARAVEGAVQSVEKDLPVIRLQPMTRLMQSAVSRQRLSAMILAVFALVAIVLAAVGLYGVVAHSVTERTREIGVRMALGAERGQVLRLFIVHGVVTAAAGAIVGVGGATVLSRWLDTLLFGVEPVDPATFVSVVLLLLVVAAIACYIPARRAARVDPLSALRGE
jgi:putative ABC transport system permease protein